MILRRIFSWFRRPSRSSAKPLTNKPAMLAMEALEERMVPASHTLAIVSPELVSRLPQAELAGADVLILDAGRDAIGQVSRALDSRSGISTVRLISHGEAGAVVLAGQRITAASLAARSVEVSAWGRALAPGADILLYGCSVASTAEGRNLADTLSRLTGADVAASTDATGAGGNLVLEYGTGAIESGLGGTQAQYDSTGLSLGDMTINFTLPGKIAGNKMHDITPPGGMPPNSTLKSVSVSGIAFSLLPGNAYATDLTFMVSPTATPTPGSTGTALGYFLGGTRMAPMATLWNVKTGSTNVWTSSEYQFSLPNQTVTPTAGVSSTTPLTVNLANQFLLVGNGVPDLSSWTGTVTVVYSVPDGDATATALTSSLNPALAGQAVTLTTTVSNTANPSTIPAGSVQFYDGTTALGSPVALNSSGIATFTTTALTSGAHSLSAKYLGATGSFLTSTSSVVTQNVQEAPAITSPATAFFPKGGFGLFQFASTGFPAPTFSVTSGTLPAGLTLLPSGTLSGVATADIGSTTVTISASNGIGTAATQSFTMAVNFPPLLPDQRPGSGDLFGPGSGAANPNTQAFAALDSLGQITAWGSSLTGGVNAPQGAGFRSIVSNSGAFAALDANGAIKVWGDSNTGGAQAGAPQGSGFQAIYSSARAFAALDPQGAITAWGDTDLGGAQTSVPAGTGFTAIFSNGRAFAALDTKGSIKSWGLPFFGGSNAPAGTGFVSIVSNPFGFSALDSLGAIKVWGDTFGTGLKANFPQARATRRFFPTTTPSRRSMPKAPSRCGVIPLPAARSRRRPPAPVSSQFIRQAPPSRRSMPMAPSRCGAEAAKASKPMRPPAPVSPTFPQATLPSRRSTLMAPSRCGVIPNSVARSRPHPLATVSGRSIPTALHSPPLMPSAPSRCGANPKVAARSRPHPLAPVSAPSSLPSMDLPPSPPMARSLPGGERFMGLAIMPCQSLAP